MTGTLLGAKNTVRRKRMPNIKIISRQYANANIKCFAKKWNTNLVKRFLPSKFYLHH